MLQIRWLFILPVFCFVISQCRPRPEVSSAKGVLSSSQPSFRVFHQGTNAFRVRFPGTKSDAIDGQAVEIRAGVVQQLDQEPVTCENLSETHQGILKRNDEYFDIDFNFDEKALARCLDNDSNRKLSLECQSSGDWDGPKTLAVCVYDRAKNLVVSGHAAPEGMLRDNSLGLAEVLPHDDTVLSYGKICAQRLGSLPRDWSCLDGKIIPITKDGVEVPFGQHQPRDRCDNQIYLGLGEQGQCVPYARLGRLQTKPDVETVFICRRYKIGNKVVQRDGGGARKVEEHIPPDVPLFQDVAIVQHNIKTGETCFFQALSGFQPQNRDLPGARIPPPDEEEVPQDIKQKYASLPLKQQPTKAASFWLKPSDPGDDPVRRQDPFEPQRWVIRGFQCVKCHDSDPFIHSPYVSQLNYTFPEGHPMAGRNDKMVPCDPGPSSSIPKPECVTLKNGVNYSKGRYSQLHKKRQKWWPSSYHIAPKNDDTCVRCHRIGSMETCGTFVKDSIGGMNVYPNYVTNYGKLFPESHWMPIHRDFFADQKTCKPNPANPNSPIGCDFDSTTWKQTFGKGAERTLECCNLALANITDKPENDSQEFKQKCVRTPITTEPPALSATNDVHLENNSEIPLQDSTGSQPGKTTVALNPTPTASGKIKYLNLKLELYHDSQGDLRIEVVHGAKRVVVFNGQELESPNAYGPLYVSVNSADNDAVRAFLNDSPAESWSIEVFDEGALETGSVKSASLDVSFD
ncbi:MAG: hypothetical protein AB7T49_06870 [Oligoflexales bacterium]